MADETKKESYRDRLAKSMEEVQKKDEAFKKTQKTLFRVITFVSLAAIVAALVLFVLFFTGTLPNADMIFVPLLTLATLLMMIRYYTVNRKLYRFNSILFIIELAFSIFIISSKINGGLV